MSDQKNRYYFTFGSHEGFPYQNTYLVVVAENINSAIEKFREKHKDRTPGFINCSFYYTEEQWNRDCAKFYTGKPAEIIE